jgi:DNA-binding response OmpR family regulator
MRARRILVVDDELSIRNLFDRILNRDGHQVILAASAHEGVQLVQDLKPDLLILDVDLPDMKGGEICDGIRQNASIRAVPILAMLPDAEVDAALFVAHGADECIAKPLDVPVLTARINTLLERPSPYAAEEIVIESGDVSIFLAERRVVVGGQPTPRFAPKEFSLLKQLMVQAPRIVDKETLALNAWGTSAQSLHRRTLDVHVRRIRQKLGPVGERRIKSVPSVGYQWTAE